MASAASSTSSGSLPCTIHNGPSGFASEAESWSGRRIIAGEWRVERRSALEPDRRESPHQLLDEILLHVAVEQRLFLFLAEDLRVVEGVFAPCDEFGRGKDGDPGLVQQLEAQALDELVFTHRAAAGQTEDLARARIDEDLQADLGLRGVLDHPGGLGGRELAPQRGAEIGQRTHADVNGGEVHALRTAQVKAAAAE